MITTVIILVVVAAIYCIYAMRKNDGISSERILILTEEDAICFVKKEGYEPDYSKIMFCQIGYNYRWLVRTKGDGYISFSAKGTRIKTYGLEPFYYDICPKSAMIIRGEKYYIRHDWEKGWYLKKRDA